MPETMPMRRDTNPIAALQTLLEDERAALLGGRLGTLEKRRVTIAALMAELSATAPRRDIEHLAQSFRRNGALMAGAVDGLKAVRARLGEFKSARETLRTYNTRGRPTEVTTRPNGGFERKA